MPRGGPAAGTDDGFVPGEEGSELGGAPPSIKVSRLATQLYTLSYLVLFSMFGTSLVVLFLVLQAPDVSLSAMVVGAVAYPLVILLALGKVRDRER